MWISAALAQDAPAGATPPPEASALGSLIPLLLIFVVFYFLLIRPQQKKLKQHQEMIHSLHRGDKVVTGGGIIGSIVKLEGDDIVHVEIAPNVKVKVARSTITSVLSRTGAPSDEKEEKKAGSSKGANDN